MISEKICAVAFGRNEQKKAKLKPTQKSEAAPNDGNELSLLFMQAIWSTKMEGEKKLQLVFLLKKV